MEKGAKKISETGQYLLQTSLMVKAAATSPHSKYFKLFELYNC